MRYNKDNYRKILEHAINEGYKFVDYLSVDFRSRQKQIILRHDVDFLPQMALEIAEIDTSYGIKASFAVMLSSPLYNPLTHNNKRIINEISLAGHNVILHCYLLPRQSREEVCRSVSREWQIMKSVFEFVQPVFAWHQPPEHASLSGIQIPNLVNTWSFAQMHYFSDSLMKHRPEQFLELIGSERLLNLLIHPAIWVSDKDNMMATLAYVLSRIIREEEREELVRVRTWKEHFRNGMPEEVLNRLEEDVLQASVTLERKDEIE